MPLDGTELAPERRALLRAADLIEEVGHAQRALRDYDGRVCAVGALMYACAGQHPREALNTSRVLGPVQFVRLGNALHVLEQELARRGVGRGALGTTVLHWNNADGRTGAEVADAMRAAALATAAVKCA